MSSLETIKSSALNSKKIQKLSQLVEKQLQFFESADFQLWLQNKTPHVLLPILQWTLKNSPSGLLSHALDWLRPELHRHGFKISTLNLNVIETEFSPRSSKNIPLFLVISGLEESLKLFFSQHFPGQHLELHVTSVQSQKRQKWAGAVRMKIHFDEKKFDLDLLSLQKNKSFEFENQIALDVKNSTKKDSIQFKVSVQLTPLLSFQNKGTP